MVNSKAKGASFEREVCWALSRFVDPAGTDTLYWRSAMSGGRATVQARRGVRNDTQLGDVTCVHPKGAWLTDAFVIECKFYADLDLEGSLLFGRGKLATFWREVSKVAAERKREPLLIARQNRTETLVVSTYVGYDTLSVHNNRYLINSRALGEVPAKVCLFREVFAPRRRVRRSR